MPDDDKSPKNHASGAPKAMTPPPPPGSDDARNVWYFSNRGQQQGPFTFVQMDAQIRGGRVTGNTDLWSPGMDGWIKAALVEQFMNRLQPPPVAIADTGEYDEISGSPVFGAYGNCLTPVAFVLSKDPKACIVSKYIRDHQKTHEGKEPEDARTFMVALPSNPALRVRARSEAEAEAAYKRYMGIRSTEHQFQVA